MEKVIALKGQGRTGKTTALKMLIAELEKKQGVVRITQSPRNYSSRKDPSNNSDVWALFCYRGVRIFVNTKGDSISEIMGPLTSFQNVCDIFVCACHPSEKVENHLIGLATGGCEFVDKTPNFQHQGDVDRLLSLIALAAMDV